MSRVPRKDVLGNLLLCREEKPLSWYLERSELLSLFSLCGFKNNHVLLLADGFSRTSPPSETFVEGLVKPHPGAPSPLGQWGLRSRICGAVRSSPKPLSSRPSHFTR